VPEASITEKCRFIIEIKLVISYQ